MDAKQAFKELERFAAARARGAVIEMSYPEPGKTLVVGVDEGTGIDARHFLKGYRIKRIIDEIIEPTVLRDWTAEDAKKHVGWSIRRTGAKNDVYTINMATHCRPFCDFTFSEYAAPLPGTDPAKWDWKPCKVEVPAPAVKPPLADAERVLSGVITALGTIHPGEFHKYAASVLADLRFVLSGIERESP